MFFLTRENLLRNKEPEKILNLTCSAPLLFEREVVINCNSFSFAFLKHLLNFKILVQFGAFKCRGREERGKEGDFLYYNSANKF